MSSQMTAAALLVIGGVVMMLLNRPRRRDVAGRLRRLDGIRRPSARQLRRAAAAWLVLLAVVALPLALLTAVQSPGVGLLAAVAVLPTGAAIVAEFHAGLRRPVMPVRVPFLVERQRRVVGSLVQRAIAPIPAPPLRQPRPRARRSRPTLTAAGGGRRLLVVPPGHAAVRVWELAETYLGSRRRYRDVLALNTNRRSPTGERISEDSRIGPGWALIMPRDAIGTGLVDLPGDPRLSWPEPAAPARTGLPAGVDRSVEPGPAPDRDFAAAGPAAIPDEAGIVAAIGSAEFEAAEFEAAEPEVEEPREASDLLDHPPADLPWDLAHGRLLAACVLDTVAAHRAQLQGRRPFGAGTSPLNAATAAVHTAAELGADRAGAEFLTTALRSLPAVSAPSVRTVRLRPDAMELELVVPRRRAPGSFVADLTGRRWRVSPAARFEPATDASGYPGLVSLGPDREGWVLVDLTAARGIVGIAGDPTATRLVATAMAVELATKRWSRDVRVTMVGFGLQLDRLDGRIHCATELGDVLDAVDRRIDDAQPDTVPEFLILADQPAAADYERLHRLAGRDGTSVSVLVAGGSCHDSWTFELDATGILTCSGLGVEVGAQAVSTATAQAIARLAHAEQTHVVDRRATLASSRPPGPPRPVPPAPELVVRLFGPPRLDGPDGPLDVDPLGVEVIAYLALHGIARPGDIAAAVFPFGTTEADLRTTLKTVVETLERAPSGHPGLLEYHDGSLALTGDVQCDWHMFLARCAAGLPDLALRLLDPVVDDESRGYRPGGYSWLVGVPLARAVSGYVADIAHLLVVDAIRDGRPDVAVAAATAGLRAQPSSRLLRGDLEAAGSMPAGQVVDAPRST